MNYQHFQNNLIELNNNIPSFISLLENLSANQILSQLGTKTIDTAPLIRNNTKNDIKKFIGITLGEINAVKRVLCRYEGNILYTWTIIKKRNLKVLNQLYVKENKLIDLFPEFDFDFYSIYANGHNIESLLNTSITTVYINK